MKSLLLRRSRRVASSPPDPFSPLRLGCAGIPFLSTSREGCAVVTASAPFRCAGRVTTAHAVTVTFPRFGHPPSAPVSSAVPSFGVASLHRSLRSLSGLSPFRFVVFGAARIRIPLPCSLPVPQMPVGSVPAPRVPACALSSRDAPSRSALRAPPTVPRVASRSRPCGVTSSRPRRSSPDRHASHQQTPRQVTRERERDARSAPRTTPDVVSARHVAGEHETDETRQDAAKRDRELTRERQGKTNPGTGPSLNNEEQTTWTMPHQTTPKTAEGPRATTENRRRETTTTREAQKSEQRRQRRDRPCVVGAERYQGADADKAAAEHRDGDGADAR
ncbi:hypothetical protein B0H03_11950 [Rathayibacter iranicus NCPPB 2253 = VKM Ac-1602]|uniref:Uncharacterized protein n=1 Tax=Rathayibacter iranicus NCPPB 2253 = VKM Ac-1602 TaxID=1328868 RepID=A0ABX5L9D4_9MICO|nr:hypothetical protein B0H03_11950 [Rathayibacter iranicus NCPPB 2253 = VKM Ac-1602]